jgi:hypothetical protein
VQVVSHRFIGERFYLLFHRQSSIDYQTELSTQLFFVCTSGVGECRLVHDIDHIHHLGEFFCVFAELVDPVLDLFNAFLAVCLFLVFLLDGHESVLLQDAIDLLFGRLIDAIKDLDVCIVAILNVLALPCVHFEWVPFFGTDLT